MTDAGAPDGTPRDEAVLGRVTDPAALDDERGGLALFETFAPQAWSGRRVRLSLPKSVRCRGCSGGGCDDCGRSGAFRLADDPARREIEIAVPRFVKSVVAIRVPRPFGDDAQVRQLLIVVEERSDPDPRMRLVDAQLAVAAEAKPAPPWVWVGIAAAAAVLAALARLFGG